MRQARVVFLAVLVSVVVSFIPAEATGTSTRTVLVSKCGNLGVQRPKQIVFTCADAGLRVERLRWAHWGARVAVGRGIQMANVCDPSCVAGTFRATTVTLHLYKRRMCSGRTHFYYVNASIITPEWEVFRVSTRLPLLRQIARRETARGGAPGVCATASAYSGSLVALANVCRR
jgi:hypothetical protein